MRRRLAEENPDGAAPLPLPFVEVRLRRFGASLASGACSRSSRRTGGGFRNSMSLPFGSGGGGGRPPRLGKRRGPPTPKGGGRPSSGGVPPPRGGGERGRWGGGVP